MRGVQVQDENEGKEVHDKILKENGLAEKEEFSWGKIISDYDVRSNISSINIIYN